MSILSAQDWHQRFTQQAGWTASIRRYLFNQIDPHGSHRILEVGCGTGAILSELDSSEGIHTHVHGIDINASFLQLAKQSATGASLVLGDAHQMPYASDSFDQAVCHFLLMWVNKPDRVLAEMKRLVRPNGSILALAEPDYGGRIDYPDELEILGVWQEESLKKQGAHTRLGRRLSTMMHAAGLVKVESGVLGGQWRNTHSPGEWQLEWQVIHSDLDAKVDEDRLNQLKKIDQQASQNGERVLYVPTFYAWGRVPEPK